MCLFNLKCNINIHIYIFKFNLFLLYNVVIIIAIIMNNSLFLFFYELKFKVHSWGYNEKFGLIYCSHIFEDKYFKWFD